MSSVNSHEHDTYPGSSKKGVDHSDHSVNVDVDEVRNPERRQIGLFSAVFIIFNRIIGTGYVLLISRIASIPRITRLFQCFRNAEYYFGS